MLLLCRSQDKILVCLLAMASGLLALGVGKPELDEHLRQAQADLDAEKYAEAARELRAAIVIQPALRGAYYQLGFALFQLSDFQAAEKAFTKELTFQPPDPYSLYYLGRIRAEQGQRVAAISFFTKSI